MCQSFNLQATTEFFDELRATALLLEIFCKTENIALEDCRKNKRREGIFKILTATEAPLSQNLVLV